MTPQQNLREDILIAIIVGIIVGIVSGIVSGVATSVIQEKYLSNEKRKTGQ